MSDVDNPLTGEHGATAVFGPQKGVKPEQIASVDAALARFADLLEPALQRTARNQPGAGAAGGLGFALHMLGAQFEPGAETVARQIGLDAALDGADWLITGEGRSDVQTLHGKAPFIACGHARAAGVPATLLSGAVDSAALPRLSEHFSGCFSPAPGPITLEVAIRDAAQPARQRSRATDAPEIRHALTGEAVAATITAPLPPPLIIGTTMKASAKAGLEQFLTYRLHVLEQARRARHRRALSGKARRDIAGGARDCVGGLVRAVFDHGSGAARKPRQKSGEPCG